MIKHTLSDKLGILKAPKNNCNSLKALIVGNHPSFIKGGGGGGGLGPSKNWVTWVEAKILLERGDNLEKGGIDIEMGGLPLFYYFTVFQGFCN